MTLDMKMPTAEQAAAQGLEEPAGEPVLVRVAAAQPVGGPVLVRPAAERQSSKQAVVGCRAGEPAGVLVK